MVSSLGKNLFKRYEDERVGRGGGEGHRIGLKGIGIPFPKYKNLAAPGGGVPSSVERKRRRDEFVGDNQNLAREVVGIGRRRTGGSRCRHTRVSSPDCLATQRVVKY